MTVLLIIFIVLFGISLNLAVFLGMQMLKKFQMKKLFMETSSHLTFLTYKGAKKVGLQPGMRTIVIQAQRPFCVELCVQLTIFGKTGYDPYGCIASDSQHRVVFRTYLGKHPAAFPFFFNMDVEQYPVRISSTNEDQLLIPQQTYPPHWWQKLGLYG